jgi:hypothetical protein
MDDKWGRAFRKLDDGELSPLFELIYPLLPPRVSERLKRLIDPESDPVSDPKAADRLVIERSQRLKRKIKTHEEKIAVAVAVLDATKKERGKIAQNLGLTKSYVDHCVTYLEVEYLPPFCRDIARQSSTYRRALARK